MKKKDKNQHCYDYPRPAVTVDVVIVTERNPLKVLLIQRKNEPFAGKWALPGGFVDMDESLETAAKRELFEETGVRATRLEQLRTFGEPNRDPRGRVISIVYLATVDGHKLCPKAADDAVDVKWCSLARPPRLAFDHAKILAIARRRVRELGLSDRS